MDDTERRTAKRSRFDQTEPEPKRSSRFDRRSRSPPTRKQESRRSRSPLGRASDSPVPDSVKKGGADPAAAAGKYKYSVSFLYSSFMPRLTMSIAAAAAKINAQIQAKKGIQHVDVPPILSTVSPAGGKSASPGASGAGNSASTVNGEMYIADGDYIKDIEVNDLRNRYTLTKGSTQKMVNTPCVNTPLIYQTFFIDTTLSLLSFPSMMLCGDFQAYLKRDSMHYKFLIGIC
jgi:hypothetical protein